MTPKRTPARVPRSRALIFPVDAGLVARAVEEGVLMSRTALTMATMNHIIVGAVRLNRHYDPAEVTAFVQGELQQLTLEQAALAAHMRRLMVEFPPSLAKSKTISDHHLLVQRRVVYSALSSELSRLQGDHGFVQEAVESSQKWAWSELGTVIRSRLAETVDPSDATEYEAEREGRMLALREIDLPALADRIR
ncbi:hypothetical protein [Subtercola boreus]|uniref:Asparagine synthase n=1 Tax=Subtercola boreus TaxID=120213 RepID=A0A3E0WGI3_9MICO|nr:hypothetical protein [Subtercola boreus]RFA22815.1 hypothetical protein B7R24_04230 [Subtercola boreus]RFA23170.1 hypothetical protein B7R23_04225 [Subtercola boreus]RFA28923.1 hypothetical protein B7R25_04240 [Subtercola boreus]